MKITPKTPTPVLKGEILEGTLRDGILYTDSGPRKLEEVLAEYEGSDIRLTVVERSSLRQLREWMEEQG